MLPIDWTSFLPEHAYWKCTTGFNTLLYCITEQQMQPRIFQWGGGGGGEPDPEAIYNLILKTML